MSRRSNQAWGSEDGSPVLVSSAQARARSASRADHHRVKEALRQSEERYRQIVQTTHEGIWMSDLQGVTTFANPQMARMLGSTPREMNGRSVYRFLFPEDRAVVQQHFSQFLRAPAGMEVEERLRRSDGTELWVLVAASVFRDRQGQPTDFLGMFTDISERKRAERGLREGMDTLETRVRERTRELQASHEALAERETQYRRLFQTILDGVLVFEGESRRMVEVNEAALRLYGYTRAEFLKLCPEALTVQREESEASIRGTLIGGAHRVSLRYHKKKDGTIFPVEISASTFNLKGRKMVCGIVRDITRKLELEREILAISDREQRRLGQDLHDDLCGQLAGTEFLIQTLAADLAAQGSKAARRAREICRMVQQTMTKTRDLARGLSPVRLEAEGLTEALRELAVRIKRVFGIRCQFQCNAPVLVSDHRVAMHLYRIAQEAVGNAIKHGQASRIEIVLSEQGQRLQLAVHDNGAGMPADSFRRNGMGLQIMHYRAEVIGGSVSIQTKPGQGTTVICTVSAGLLGTNASRLE
jgi:PAS domain S-box-containing protein